MIDEVANGFCNNDLSILSNLKEALVKNKQANPAKFLNNSDDTSTSVKINMPLVEKGDAGYIPDMDLDQDGTITYEEFKQYCDENQISMQDRIKLMELMQTSKMLKEKEDRELTEEENKKEEEEKVGEQKEANCNIDSNLKQAISNYINNKAQLNGLIIETQA